MQSAGLKGSHLSLQQARLWSLQRESQTYRTQCTVLLEGELDTEVVQRAFEHLISQHEILHTVFYSLRGMDVPMQIIDSRVQVCCQTISLEDASEPAQATRLTELFKAVREQPFDLAHGPLLRCMLVRLSARKHVLLLSLPALCADASTLKHLVAELGRAYVACLRGKDLADADDVLQYVDVSAWQNKLLASEETAKQGASWSKIDLSQLSTIHLPFQRATKDKAWEQEKVFAPQRLEVAVEETFQTQVQTLTHRLGVSVEAFLLTCWQVLLWRLTAQSPSLVGVACDGRHYEELATALGLYTRMVPLSTSLSEDQPFERVLTQVSTSLQEAVEEQIYFTWEASLAAANNEQPPFFPISFECEDWPSSWTAGPLTYSLVQRTCCLEPFALNLSALQGGQRLRLELHYDPTRFSLEQVKRLAGCLSTLLHSAVSQPRAQVGSLPLLSAAQQQQLLQSFASPSAAIPSQTLIQLFETQVERRSAQLAVVAGGEQLSYEQLNRRANQLAHFLRRQGVGPKILVGLCMERSVSMLVGLLAIWKAGGAYVPLDPDMPLARLAYQLADVQAPVVLTQEHLLSRLPTWSGRALCLDTDARKWAGEPSSNPEGGNQLEDLAYVIYTSGSTGVPKGVQIRQQSVVNYTHSMCRLIAPEPGLHFATVSTLAADLGNTAIFCALASGGCLHVLSYETVTSGQTFADYVAQYPLDVLKIVPSHLSALLSACPEGGAPSLLPRRFLVLGGEALKPGLLNRIRQVGSQCCVINHYGPTETTIGILVNVLGVLDQDAQGESGEGAGAEELSTVPIGRPIANSEAYILDGQQQVVPVGVIGELYLAGTGLAVGYLHQEEQTRQRFVTHPFRREAGFRLYKTGDLARYTEEGLIEFVGRGDSQVKLRGYRIELGEIEAVLGRHANVRECVVMLSEEESGEGRLVAYVVARQQPPPSSRELRDFVGEQLPVYMVPSAFVFLRALPLTANGKVDRQQLITGNGKVDQQMLTAIDSSVEAKTPVQPRDAFEFQLLQIWEEILNVRPISVMDNFFDLGGHSILAVRLMSRIHQQFGQDLALAILFQNPTIAELAVVLRQQTSLESRSALVKIQPGGSKPPFFCVHAAGGNVFCYTNLARHLGPDQPFYGLQTPDLTGSGAYFSKVEDMAAHYIAAIQTVQAQGPYLLGGWSLGGVVAFEMAQQLQRQGHEVALLAIIDSHLSLIHPHAPVEMLDVSDTTLAKAVLEGLNQVQAGEDFYRRPPEEQLNYALEQVKIANGVPVDTDLRQFRRLSRMRKTNLYAARTYIPQVYPHRLALFRARESVKIVGDSALPNDVLTQPGVTGGWEKLAAGGLEVHLIPGKHVDMVDEPNVQALALSLRQSIDKVLEFHKRA
ncbi:MAG: non-ribosomal peptide synthetase [Ktedonobacteraceae bacterium]